MKQYAVDCDEDEELPQISERVRGEWSSRYHGGLETIRVYFEMGEFGGIYDFESPDGFRFGEAYVHPSQDLMVVGFTKGNDSPCTPMVSDPLPVKTCPRSSDAKVPEVSNRIGDKISHVNYYPDCGSLDFVFEIDEFAGIEDFDVPEGFEFGSAHIHPSTGNMTVCFREE